jgi:5'-deoxynucleotidase YfbR-like HD superfamily hydrolase
MFKKTSEDESYRKFYSLSPLGGFYMDDPDSLPVDIKTISDAISKICRFNGRVTRFYSVAEHSIIVSLLLEKENPDNLGFAMAGLLHDVGESWYSDVPRPLKYLMDSSKLEEHEISFKKRAVKELTGLDYDLYSDRVNYYDLLVCAAEGISLVNKELFEDWMREHLGYSGDEIKLVKLAQKAIYCTDPIRSSKEFLKRFNALKEGL